MVYTVHVKDIFQYLKQYLKKENVSSFVVGEPKQLNNTPSESVRFVDPFVKKLRKEFPLINVERYDERFTSKMAFQSMIDMGMKKKDRRDKANIDKISAVILLQSYMNYLAGNK